LRVFFGPRQVSITRLQKGLQYKGLQYKTLQYDRLKNSRLNGWLKPKPFNAISEVCEQRTGGSPWAPALEALERCFQKTPGADAVITVSNHFVRYTVLSAQKDIANPAELNTYAEFHMREVFGERAGAWVLSTGAWDPCLGGLCAGIDRDLLEGLEELAVRCKIRLQYVEPYLAFAFDHFRRRLQGPDVWFALVEEERLCLALLKQGAWQQVRNQRIVHDVREELLAALEQEAILLSGGKRAAGTVYILAPGYAQLALPEDCGWRAAWLEPDSLALPVNLAALPAADEATACAASS
jgi:hypothetical protein